MARKLRSDRLMFLTTMLLVSFSVVMVHSASFAAAIGRSGPNLVLVKQVFWTALGVAILSIVMQLDYRIYQRPALLWTAVVVVSIALIGVLFARPVNGARRWFGIGGIGVQPSEIAKIVAVLCTAALLERRIDRAHEPAALAPVGALIGGFMLLILIEPDYGTAFTLGLIAAAMVFAAGLRYRYVFGLALIAAPTLYLVLISAPYRLRRLLSFLNPWDDPLGDGYQLIQSLIAVGAGGVFGRGFMAGVQKLFYLPEPHTDFIYSVVAEEFGLLGATLTLLCFGVIAWRGLRAAIHAPDPFGAFLAVGLTMMIAAQAFINISVVLGLLPTKGIPLPFVSAGGSSLIVSLLGMGILLNVSQHATADE